MKNKVASILHISLLMMVLSACNTVTNKVVNSLGNFKKYEYYSEGGFQDYTDYAKYYFDSVDFTSNKYFKSIQPTDLMLLNEHLDDFENWIEYYKREDALSKLVIHYDFNRSCIDDNDYLYICSQKYDLDNGKTEIVSYDVYFYDCQTNILFYFHNNI